jgi:primase-polymerase (primpol)-like protein
MFKSETKSSQPVWLEPQLQNIPEELKTQPWAVWIAEPRLDSAGKPTGKYNKAPRNPLTGIKVGANQPDKFGTYEEARKSYASGKYTGVGVLLTGNGITGVDIDDAPRTLKERPEVLEWIRRAANASAYCELSPGGKGFRLFIYAQLPSGSKNKVGPLEIYDDARFLTITGHSIDARSDK